MVERERGEVLPPPQSPDSWPRAGKREVCPSRRRPAALIPAPQTTPTASGAAVPARSSANRSLSTVTASARPRPATPASSRSTSTGRSAPARYADSRLNGSAAGIAAAARARRTRSPSCSRQPGSPTTCGETVGP
ncbi:hypothetical protein OHA72_40300 [Dactylosporangium sp. NBC_01737]|uniref:hypothetical protein n=1 Tax=Dactylosporangium sp. NBC_01737 TaxID=2975959 RepID=UPI002E15C23F|nr:hypothetical protein OHA72_40300 [Dactylosporangium sp. NBC_01737]